jgi:hypothetical protein
MAVLDVLDVTLPCFDLIHGTLTSFGLLIIGKASVDVLPPTADMMCPLAPTWGRAARRWNQR